MSMHIHIRTHTHAHMYAHAHTHGHIYTHEWACKNTHPHTNFIAIRSKVHTDYLHKYNNKQLAWMLSLSFNI